MKSNLTNRGLGGVIERDPVVRRGCWNFRCEVKLLRKQNGIEQGSELRNVSCGVRLAVESRSAPLCSEQK